MPIKNSSVAVVASLAIAAGTVSAQARDRIHIVGSSTVFPYTEVVVRRFVDVAGVPEPILVSTGTGGGMEQICSGVGEETPDITGASRPMTAQEFEICRQNGVMSISEAHIGYDGLSIAVSRDNPARWNLSFRDIYLALGAQVPVDGAWVDNPHVTWNEIDPALPQVDIRVYGPPSTSGTRDAFVELAMHAGCRTLDFVVEGGYDETWIEENCTRMRMDGRFVEFGENDEQIVQALVSEPAALGIFGYSFLFRNLEALKPVSVEGRVPDFRTIAELSYPLSRPLFLYIKNDHRGHIPHLEEFIDFYMSDDALSYGGYLLGYGLVPRDDEYLVDMQMSVMNGVRMAAPR